MNLLEIDKEKIRRSKPYLGDHTFEFDKIPLVTKNYGAPTRMFGITRKDNNEVIACVSDKYALVPHTQVTDLMESYLNDKNIGYERKIKLSHEGARMYAEYWTNNIQNIKSDDGVKTKALVTNSYDGGMSIMVNIMGIRMECLNGMMGYGAVFSHKKKHIGNVFETTVQLDDFKRKVDNYRNDAPEIKERNDM